jgi:transcriptional regulator with XRE-family HTH domain
MSEEAEAMGLRFQELRHEKGLSQSELAKAAGVPIASLKNWEQGRRMPAFDAAFRVAKALGITLDELAGKVFETTPEATPEAKPAKKRASR